MLGLYNNSEIPNNDVAPMRKKHLATVEIKNKQNIFLTGSNLQRNQV